MAMTNAERQRRYIARLKAKAASAGKIAELKSEIAALKTEIKKLKARKTR